MSATMQSVQPTITTTDGNALPTDQCVRVRCEPFDRKSSAKAEVLSVSADTTVQQLKELLTARLGQSSTTTVTLFVASPNDTTMNYSQLFDDTTVSALSEMQQPGTTQPLTVLYTTEKEYGCWFCCPCLVGLCVGICCCS